MFQGRINGKHNRTGRGYYRDGQNTYNKSSQLIQGQEVLYIFHNGTQVNLQNKLKGYNNRCYATAI